MKEQAARISAQIQGKKGAIRFVAVFLLGVLAGGSLVAAGYSVLGVEQVLRVAEVASEIAGGE